MHFSLVSFHYFLYKPTGTVCGPGTSLWKGIYDTVLSLCVQRIALSFGRVLYRQLTVNIYVGQQRLLHLRRRLRRILWG